MLCDIFGCIWVVVSCWPRLPPQVVKVVLIVTLHVQHFLTHMKNALGDSQCLTVVVTFGHQLDHPSAVFQ